MSLIFNKIWKKTFKTIHQLLCFVGHPVPRAWSASLYQWQYIFILISDQCLLQELLKTNSLSHKCTVC